MKYFFVNETRSEIGGYHSVCSEEVLFVNRVKSFTVCKNLRLLECWSLIAAFNRIFFDYYFIA